MIIRLRYLKDGLPTGRDYSYFSNDSVSVGDTVVISGTTKGIVTEVDVPEEDIELFKDRVKTIQGKAEDVQQ